MADSFLGMEVCDSDLVFASYSLLFSSLSETECGLYNLSIVVIIMIFFLVILLNTSLHLSSLLIEIPALQVLRVDSRNLRSITFLDTGLMTRNNLQ